MKRIGIVALLIATSVINGFGQTPRKDALEARPYKPGYFDKDIMTGIEKFEKQKTTEVRKPILKADVSKLSYYPKSVDTTW